MSIQNSKGDFFLKSQIDEEFLSNLNTALYSFEKEQLIEGLPDSPTVHLIGLPRSGTTLCMQQLISGTDIGYINNLIAAFWQAPVTGILLSNKLLAGNRNTTFKSVYGRTQSVTEPHEFGYFWSERLSLEDLREPVDRKATNVDWKSLRIILQNMCRAFQRPVLFKSFFLGWYADLLLDRIGPVGFIHIERDPVECALSLIRMRRNTMGDENAWVSLKPKQYDWLKKEDYWVQVAGQVYYLNRSFTENLKKVPAKNVIRTSLDDLCSAPNTLIEKTTALLESLGADVLNVNRIKATSFRRDASLYDKGMVRKVERAYRDFMDGKYESRSIVSC